MTSKYYKDFVHYQASAGADSVFGTIPNDLHRKRRGVLSPYFSRRTILELEDIIHEKTNKLCDMLRRHAYASDPALRKPVNLYLAFRAISIDVITDYAFDRCWNFLDRQDLGEAWNNQVRETGHAFWMFQQFPLLKLLMFNLPPWLVKHLSPAAAAMRDAITVRDTQTTWTRLEVIA